MSPNGPLLHGANLLTKTSNELNPSIQDNASKTDAYINKRKVVRGGSWKDAARFIQVNTRSYEYQNEDRSFIGFRCVRSLIGERKTSK